jgi:cobyrinic acid a,c-diamide synthase
MRLDLPRILVSGLRGGGGKTLVSVGLTAALRRRGTAVIPFKKGPDYIDAAWLSRAAGAPCYNLDTFLMGEEGVLESIRRHAGAAGKTPPPLAVIEGNRGLFDGMDEKGTTSTAELARILDAPVILVVDCAKTTRTVCALIEGCRAFDPRIRIAGVILNRLGGRRHEDVIRACIETSCRIPVLGALPRLGQDPFPERHLGRVTPEDHPDSAGPVTAAAEAARKHLDLDLILDLARAAAPLRIPKTGMIMSAGGHAEGPAVGILRDAAFSFYYPDNIEALEDLGARVVEISALDDKTLPDVDALYLGGGFPETHAGLLAGNESFKTSLREAVERGLPVYAECGGALYAGRSLTYEGRTYPMTGILPLDFHFSGRPRGHGYSILETVGRNPFYETGTVIRGHEFHYSEPSDLSGSGIEPLFRVRKGHGMDGRVDGVSHRNLLALYTHVHAAGTRHWAESLVRLAAAFSGSKPAKGEHNHSKKGLKNFSCLSI